MRLQVGAALVAAAMAATAGVAQAATVTEAPAFLPTYTGTKGGDLEVTSFTVNYSQSAADFLLSATFNGLIGATAGAGYVVGVNTGAGAKAPFASIGEPNVTFDQTFTVNPDGSVTGLSGVNAAIIGNSFSLTVPQASLVSTGADPSNYAFALWPHDGAGTSQIASFAPQNADLPASPTPEPAGWALMIAGFGLAGVALRRRRSGAGVALAV